MAGCRSLEECEEHVILSTLVDWSELQRKMIEQHTSVYQGRAVVRSSRPDSTRGKDFQQSRISRSHRYLH